MSRGNQNILTILLSALAFGAEASPCGIGLGSTPIAFPKQLPLDQVIADFKSAKQRVIAIDYDRTIRRHHGFEQNPAPAPELLKMISELAQYPNTLVLINSARSKLTLQAWFGHLNSIGLAAENGYWYRAPGGEWKIEEPDADLSFFEPARKFLRDIADYVHGSILLEKTASLTFVHRNLDPRLGPKLAHDLEGILVRSRALRMRVIHNRNAVEFLPVGVNKGSFLTKLLNSFSDPAETFFLVAGDDEADEDMFQAVHAWKPSAWTIRVQEDDNESPPPSSAATWVLPHVEAILKLLSQLPS